MIIEGTTEKVVLFKLPLKSIYNQNLGFIEQEMYFEQYKKVQTIENLLNFIIFVMRIFSGDLFRAAPYRLLFVLRKDALFHCFYC